MNNTKVSRKNLVKILKYAFSNFIKQINKLKSN